jgi:hypothetical protein
MRIVLVAAAVLFACTSPTPPPPDKKAIDADTQALLKPLPADRSGPISGFVSARDQHTLSLDSGGQHLIPLKVDAQTPTLRDGQKGTAGQIQEGDVVRAAYSIDPDGNPRATQLVVNSKPFTGRATPPGTNAEQPQQQEAQAPNGNSSGEPAVVMEVTPVESREPLPAGQPVNATKRANQTSQSVSTAPANAPTSSPQPQR